MNLFDTLLEIKTGQKELTHKAVYIENSIDWDKWAYFIYYYDLVNNAFYINDLDSDWTKNRTSAKKLIEEIISKAYKQEINSYWDIIRKILQHKKPKVFCFYHQNNNRLIVIDKINLKDFKIALHKI